MRHIFLILLGTVHAPIPAQQWLPLDGPSGSGMCASHDTARRRTVALGADGSTWEWDGLQLLQRAIAAGPPPRTLYAMAFDALRRQTLLFGGRSPTSGAALGDTWAWDGASWQQLSSPVSPAPRNRCAMAFDPARGRMVLYGGDPGFTDTWEHDGSSWSGPWPGPGPTVIAPSGMAFEPRIGEVMLVGQSATGSDTWSWNGARWNQVAAGPPIATQGCGLAYDPRRGRMVLLQAFGSGASDLWEHDGFGWLHIGAVLGLAALSPAMYFDASSGAMVIQGGSQPGTVLAYSNTSTWTWNGSVAARLAERQMPSARTGFTVACDTTRQRAVLFGGLGYANGGGVTLAETWEWTGTRWLRCNPVAAPTARTGAAACFDPVRNVTLLFGGTAGNDLWSWDGATWTSRLVSPAPGPRTGAAMAWDPARNRVLLFGGGGILFGALNDTWEWDGSIWTQRQPVTSPSARIAPLMAFDQGRGRMVLHGGHPYGLGTTPPFTDTWEWDGAQWTQVPGAIGPGTGGMAWDPARGRIAVATAYQVFEFDGVNWTRAEALPSDTLFAAALVTDPARNRIVLFDGTNVWERTTSPADVAPIGQGCGTPIPRLLARARPRIGIPWFGMDLLAQPAAPALFVLGARGNAVLGNGCTLLIQPAFAGFAVADASGIAALPVPLPLDPRLRGLVTFAQSASLDAGSPGGFALSPGLRITIGD